MKELKYAVIAAAAMTIMSAGQSQAQIKIATAGPMTGQYASFGEQMQRGAELAVKDINAAGGVLGQKLVLSIGDGSVTANVVNPGIIQDGTYTVEFYELEVGKRSLVTALDEGDIIDPKIESAAKGADVAATVTTYDIKRDGSTVFDGYCRIPASVFGIVETCDARAL